MRVPADEPREILGPARPRYQRAPPRLPAVTRPQQDGETQLQRAPAASLVHVQVSGQPPRYVHVRPASSRLHAAPAGGAKGQVDSQVSLLHTQLPRSQMHSERHLVPKLHESPSSFSSHPVPVAGCEGGQAVLAASRAAAASGALGPGDGDFAPPSTGSFTSGAEEAMRPPHAVNIVHERVSTSAQDRMPRTYTGSRPSVATRFTARRGLPARQRLRAGTSNRGTTSRLPVPVVRCVWAARVLGKESQVCEWRAGERGDPLLVAERGRRVLPHHVERVQVPHAHHLQLDLHSTEAFAGVLRARLRGRMPRRDARREMHRPADPCPDRHAKGRAIGFVTSLDAAGELSVFGDEERDDQRSGERVVHYLKSTFMPIWNMRGAPGRAPKGRRATRYVSSRMFLPTK